MPTYWSCGYHDTSGKVRHSGDGCQACKDRRYRLDRAKDKVVELAKAAVYADGADEAAQKLMDLGDAVEALMAIEDEEGVKVLV